MKMLRQEAADGGGWKWVEVGGVGGERGGGGGGGEGAENTQENRWETPGRPRRISAAGECWSPG